MPIRQLPTLLINQIAAGEVIERPASVVKELVDNALDAGASRIGVVIEDGGRQRVRVSDNGRGIPEAELALALSPHATSKLQSAEQLESIDTLGFRGEALASIASVSRLTLTSRPGDADAAATLHVTGDLSEGPTPAAGPVGTVVDVADLFVNTPARRKFLRAASTEFGHIADTLNRIAMVHPEVGFELSHNGRTTLDLPPAQDRAARCIAVLGKELNDAMLECTYAPPPTDQRVPANVWALAGQPSIARASTKFIYLCVNGRPVTDRQLLHAVKEAYRGLIPPDRHPVVVVHLGLDPRDVDVNVHPAKSEVRFRRPAEVHSLVLSTLRNRLLETDLTPAARFADAKPSAPSFEHETNGTVANPSAFVDYFKRMDPKQKGMVFSEVRRAIEEDEEARDSTLDFDSAPTQPHTPDAGARVHEVLQVHNSYVVTQDEEGLLIVDQHALHERVMFETLRKRVLDDRASLESQRLLMPVILDADESRMRGLEQVGPLLERIGVDAEPAGPKAIAVHGFPSFLFERRVDPAEFLPELLDRAAAGDLDAGDATATESALHEVLDMMSCKAAVKAGDAMDETQLAALLARRDEVERSSNCPHGRPTTLRLSLKDLEKQFGRT